MKARIIIPVWGAKYVSRLDSACLPALLAPGNLPHLAEHFECELVIVTQSSLFSMVRELPSVRAAGRYASLRLVAIDDVLSHPHFYGLTITHALYRGFTDLGDAARDVWCLFLNADFILADGSYRALAERMLAGERCIFAPSYCTIEEFARPVLTQRAESGNGVLAMPPREMAGLILDHRHFTIRSKIINWRMYRIDRVDQFYYLHDNDTLLGRQLPIAIVAFRPERVPLEPVAFWDYGVVAEVCPTSPLCVLGDSDDFLMLELRGRQTMGSQLRLGWMDKDEIARDLTLWTTKDQRDCGEFTLTLHRGDLPADIDDGRRALEDYYRDVMRRVAPEPRDHRNHYIWTGAIELHKEWLSLRATGKVQSPAVDSQAIASGKDDRRSFGALLTDLAKALFAAPFSRGAGGLYRRLFDVMRAVYLKLFGRIPDVGPLHPHWVDLEPAIGRIARLSGKGTRALAVWTLPGAAIAPHLSRWADDVTNSTPGEILDDAALAALGSGSPYDFCVLELNREEFTRFGRLHARLRGLVRKGGKIMVFYQTRGAERVIERDFQLISDGMPESDVGELQIRGGRLLYLIQKAWEAGRVRAQSGRVSDLVRFGLTAAFVGPIAAVAARMEGEAGSGNFRAACTSLFLEVTVI